MPDTAVSSIVATAKNETAETVKKEILLAWTWIK